MTNQQDRCASRGEPGFIWTVDILRADGSVDSGETTHNLIPQEGCDFYQALMFKGAGQVTTWYIGIYEGNYTPVSGIKAVDIAATASESTAYTPTTRVEFNEGAVAAGSVDNSANRAEFAMTLNKTIYGGFIGSAQARGATTGVLISAVRFASPKVLSAGDTLRVTAQNVLTSA